MMSLRLVHLSPKREYLTHFNLLTIPKNNMWESLQKFGISRCDLPTMLTNIDFFLRVLTLKVDPRNQKRVPILFYILAVISAASYFYVYLISMMWFVSKCAKMGEVLPALIVLSLGVSSEIGSIKFCSMFYYEKTARQIVAQILASDALVVPGSRFHSNLMKTLRLVKQKAVIFWLVIIGNGVVYVLKPIVMPGRHLMEDIFIIYGLEPIFESPNYEIAFTLMAIGVYVTVYLPSNITAFLIIISGYIEAQMLAWSEELLNLIPDAEKQFKNNYSDDLNDSSDDKSNAINELVKERLRVIIKGHATNVTVFKQVENVFRTAIALEFFLLIVGLIAELLGGLENTYMEIPFAMMQVAMDCLTGQRLIDASLKFEQAVYSCGWETLDQDNMKLVLVMLQNSQKELRLTAGGISTLSFCSLMSVVKSIYSAYTTLRSTMK